MLSFGFFSRSILLDSLIGKRIFSKQSNFFAGRKRSHERQSLSKTYPIWQMVYEKFSNKKPLSFSLEHIKENLLQNFLHSEEKEQHLSVNVLHFFKSLSRRCKSYYKTQTVFHYETRGPDGRQFL